nr:MAG TPA: Mon1, Ccz1, Rab small monomeric GEF protein, endosomal maturation [Caudoviricetes sp.]
MGFMPTFAIFCPLLEKKVGTKKWQIIYYLGVKTPKMR